MDHGEGVRGDVERGRDRRVLEMGSGLGGVVNGCSPTVAVEDHGLDAEHGVRRRVRRRGPAPGRGAMGNRGD
jgi:hypothetical protein